ncbi:MAG: type II toxin-antitoxin system YafQ family toxin [Treponema sp.]|nr:type II toxin-antitoxin system YafQ family toxin [Treponema sp.]
MDRLAAGETLEPKYKDHPLTGKLKGYRDCHIQPDWLLIYQYHHEGLYLYLTRTGSHSDLF